MTNETNTTNTTNLKSTTLKDFGINFFKDNLNKQQYEASMYTDTTNLIIAGAGSGKTRVLTYKMLNLYINKQINVNNVLAVTFTNKAANEMKERLVSLYNGYKFKEEELKEKTKGIEEKKPNNKDITANPSTTDSTPLPPSSIDDLMDKEIEEKNKKLKGNKDERKLLKKHEVNIGTFHSICNKLLREYIKEYNPKFSKTFTICDTNDSLGIIKQVMKDKGISAKDFPPKITRELISKLKSNAILPTGSDEYIIDKNIPVDDRDVFNTIYTAYQKELETSNAVDFDDLLMFVYFILKKNKEVRTRLQERYKYILVDEAQDTNRLQFQIIKFIAGDTGNVTFIGDDFQSIYMWRGAEMNTFLNLKGYFPDMKIFKLETNYRSSNTIVQVGKNIIKNNDKQYEKDLKAHRDNGEQVKVMINSSSYKENLNIVDLITKIKEAKGYERKDFGILYRINALSAGFEKIFLERKIPYKVWGGFRFFERQEIKDILAYMKYIINKEDNMSLGRIINVPARKIGKTTIEKLRKAGIENNLTLSDMIENVSSIPVKITKGVVSKLKDFNDGIENIRMDLNDENPMSLIMRIVRDFNYEEYLIEKHGIDEASERMDNIGQLVNMGNGYETGVDKISEFLNELSLLSDFKDDKGDENAINLMTVHSSKGLEFPVVFVVGLEEGIFPGSKSSMEQEILEEERRLMYVAVTRAKDLLFLSRSQQRQMYGSFNMNEPSRFLNEISEEYLKVYYL